MEKTSGKKSEGNNEACRFVLFNIYQRYAFEVRLNGENLKEKQNELKLIKHRQRSSAIREHSVVGGSYLRPIRRLKKKQRRQIQLQLKQRM